MSEVPVVDRMGEAYVALLDHCAACTECRTTPVLCPEGQRLADVLRAVRREVRAS